MYEEATEVDVTNYRTVAKLIGFARYNTPDFSVMPKHVRNKTKFAQDLIQEHFRSYEKKKDMEEEEKKDDDSINGGYRGDDDAVAVVSVYPFYMI